MKNFYLFFLSFCILNLLNIKISIEDGVYNIISVEKNFSLFYDNEQIKLNKENLGSDNINFRLKYLKPKNNSNFNYLNIEHLITNSYLGIALDKTENTYNIIMTKNKEMYDPKNTSFSFSFVSIGKDKYLIKNTFGCYLYGLGLNLYCTLPPLSNYHQFFLLKIFSEIDKGNQTELAILENEPIDVLIIHKDLSDPSLKRKGIKQTMKDERHEEIIYCIRSILQNIPWIRKIFIFLPNEKVKFLKSPELISEKITFVKDKELLGYDSSNIYTIQFSLWKMKQFGISDNFIIIEEYCFINKPLNKSDFFYVQNNSVVPAILATRFQVYTSKTLEKDYNHVKKNLEQSLPQSSKAFIYSKYNTYLFYIEKFGASIIIPYFTHNVIPINIKDLKEVYDLINESQHRNATLEALYRHIDTLHFQAAVNVYTFNKYFRKVNLIKYSYIDIGNNINGNYNSDLFCINIEDNKDYSQLSYQKAKIVMNKLFPNVSEYEIINYTDIPFISYQIIKNMEKEKNQLSKPVTKINVEILKPEFKEKIEFIGIFKNLEKKMKKENKKKLKKISKLNKNYTVCLNENYNLEKEKSYYLSYEKDDNTTINDVIEKWKEEIEKKKEKKQKNIYQMDTYIDEINKIIKQIKIKENRKYILYFISFLEFFVLVIFLCIFFYFFIYEKKNHRNNNKDEKTLPIL